LNFDEFIVQIFMISDDFKDFKDIHVKVSWIINLSVKNNYKIRRN
jgi:hypothetical protein